jgi:alpha-beta hydrolase superfamily lysophospholipase
MDLSLKLIRIIGVLLVIAILLHSAGCLSYRSLLFQRDSVTLAQVQAGARDHDLRLWPVDTRQYLGVASLHAPPNPRGTIVLFHGNAGLASHRSYFVKALHLQGYRVVLMEYPGYGARPGGLSEKNLLRDGMKAAEAARAEFGGPLYIWGESLGCAVASGVAAGLKEKPAGLILLTPWDNLPKLAAHLFPSLPTRLFVRDRFDNAANLEVFKGRTAFLISSEDEVIPVAHSQRLFDGYTGPKKLWVFTGAGHCSWPSSPIAPWWREVMAFLENSGSPQPASGSG